jgi:hypothetical protein
MNELVERLTKPSAVIIGTRLSDAMEDFRGQAERGYIFVKFTETRGGTELGVTVERDACDLAAVASGSGKARIVGTLVLNYVRVRVHAEVSVPSLEGTGHLEVIEEVTPAQLAEERARRAST